MDRLDWFNGICGKADRVHHIDYFVRSGVRVISVFEDLTGNDSVVMPPDGQGHLHFAILNSSHRRDVQVTFISQATVGALRFTNADKCTIRGYRLSDRKYREVPFEDLLHVEVKDPARIQEVFITRPIVDRDKPNNAGATVDLWPPMKNIVSLMYEQKEPLKQQATANPRRFDVLLVTVNRHEFDAVHALGRELLGTDPESIPLKRRVYFDLGSVGGVRVGLIRSQMGSTQPGATMTTTLQAMHEVNPRFLISVGIAFGVDPEKQPIGEILYSEKLQDYNLIKAATNEQTGELTIIPRGDRVSPNPTLLNRVQSAADKWRVNEDDVPISPVLIVSGDCLVDNFDYRQQLQTLFPEARGGEMEATGIYSASREEETPWMIIKAISDYADGKKRENKEDRQRLAAANAARFVFYFLGLGSLADSQDEIAKASRM